MLTLQSQTSGRAPVGVPDHRQRPDRASMSDAHRVDVTREKLGAPLGRALKQDIGAVGCVIPLPGHHGGLLTPISPVRLLEQVQSVACDVVDVVQPGAQAGPPPGKYRYAL